MKRTRWIQVLAGVVFPFALCGSLAAQQEPPTGAPKPAATAAASRGANGPAHKVWTDEDLQGLKTPADLYLEQEAAEREQAAAAGKSAAAKNAVANSSQAQAAPRDSFLHPKRVEEADHNIQHEQNDLVSQQQYVEELKKRIATAPADQKAHLQQVLALREKTIQDIQSETQELEADKAKLEQQQAAGSAATPDIGMPPQTPPAASGASGPGSAGSPQPSGSGDDSSGGGPSQQPN